MRYLISQVSTHFRQLYDRPRKRLCYRTLEEVRSTGHQAHTMAKRDFNRQLPPLDLSIFQDSVGSPECIEAWTAFSEKRPPRWPGRK